MGLRESGKNQIMESNCWWEDFHADSLDQAIDELQQYDQEGHALVLTQATLPFLVVYVNSSWVELCGYAAAEIQGRSMRIMQVWSHLVHLLTDMDSAHTDYALMNDSFLIVFYAGKRYR